MRLRWWRHFKVPPVTRTLRSTRRQIGNAMHCNCVGALHFSLLLKLPHLGAPCRRIAKKLARLASADFVDPRPSDQLGKNRQLI